MPKKRTSKKKTVVRVRIVPIERLYRVIRQSLRTLDVAVADYQKKAVSKATLGRAYVDFSEAMRKLGLGGEKTRKRRK